MEVTFAQRTRGYWKMFYVSTMKDILVMIPVRNVLHKRDERQNGARLNEKWHSYPR